MRWVLRAGRIHGGVHVTRHVWSMGHTCSVWLSFNVARTLGPTTR